MTEKKKRTKINRLKENSYGGNWNSNPGGSVNQAESETKAEEKQNLSPYEKAVMNCLKILKTPKAEWTALSIIGVRETEDIEGRIREVPVYNFKAVKMYKHAPTPYQSSFPPDVYCELCSHRIKTVYWIVNNSKKMYMGVGSECITGFAVDFSASGKDMVNEVKKSLKENLVIKLKGVAILLQDVVFVLNRENLRGSSVTKNLSQLARTFELIVSSKVLKKSEISQNMNTRITNKYLKLNEEKGIEKALNSAMEKLTGLEHDLLGDKPGAVRMSVEDYCGKVAVIKKGEASGEYIIPWEKVHNYYQILKEGEEKGKAKIIDIVYGSSNWHGYRFMAVDMLDKAEGVVSYDFSVSALRSKHIINQYESLGWIREGAYRENIKKEYDREWGY